MGYDGQGDVPEVEATVGRPALGTMLTDRSFITKEQLAEALSEGEATGERLGEVIVRRGWISEHDLAQVLADQWQLGFVDRASIWFDGQALGRMTKEDAQRLEALPTSVRDGRIVVAVACAARSTVAPSPHDRMVAAAAPAKTGTSASTAGGVKLAATIRRCSRHAAPSEVSRPRPITGASNDFTMFGFAYAAALSSKTCCTSAGSSGMCTV